MAVLLNLKQVCERIHTTPGTFRVLYCKRQFDRIPPMIKRDGKWLILERDLDSWILSRYGRGNE